MTTRELHMPKISFYDILHKHLMFRSYKVHTVQAVLSNDATRRYDVIDYTTATLRKPAAKTIE